MKSLVSGVLVVEVSLWLFFGEVFTAGGEVCVTVDSSWHVIVKSFSW